MKWSDAHFSPGPRCIGPDGHRCTADRAHVFCRCGTGYGVPLEVNNLQQGVVFSTSACTVSHLASRNAGSFFVNSIRAKRVIPLSVTRNSPRCRPPLAKRGMCGARAAAIHHIHGVGDSLEARFRSPASVLCRSRSRIQRKRGRSRFTADFARPSRHPIHSEFAQPTHHQPTNNT